MAMVESLEIANTSGLNLANKPSLGFAQFPQINKEITEPNVDRNNMEASVIL